MGQSLECSQPIRLRLRPRWLLVLMFMFMLSSQPRERFRGAHAPRVLRQSGSDFRRPRRNQRARRVHYPKKAGEAQGIRGDGHLTS